MSFSATSTKAARAALKSFRYSVLLQRRGLATSSTADVEDRDIVIVGGGPAGLALASALGSSSSVRQNARVTLVEGGDLTKIENWIPGPGTYSNRVVSLTNASQAFLKDIGAWDYVEEARTCAVERMEVWDGVSDARIEFSAADISSGIPGSGMARLTENFNLQRGLLKHLETIPEVELLQQTKVASIVPDSQDRGGWPLIHLDNNKVIRARLLVGADGFNSPVRTYAQIPAFGWAYDTQAIVATMDHAPRGAYEGPNTTAYQRFLTTGPIAFLPLSPTSSTLVWSTRPTLAKALLASDPEVLSAMINAAFRLPHVSMQYLHRRILESHSQGTPLSAGELREEIKWREESHGIDQTSAYASSVIKADNLGIPPSDSEAVPPLVTQIQTGTAASFPIRFNHAETYIGEGSRSRTVLVGDAAHTIHPLAGQGLNLGLGDVECLAKVIENSLQSGGDIGSYTSLLPYTQERYLANHTVMSACDKLHKLYSTDLEPIVWARSVGLEVLNELDSVKAGLMISAGSQATRKARPGATAWSLAGDAVQLVSSTVRSASMLSGVLGGAIGNTLSNMRSRRL